MKKSFFQNVIGYFLVTVIVLLLSSCSFLLASNNLDVFGFSDSAVATVNSIEYATEINQSDWKAVSGFESKKLHYEISTTKGQNTLALGITPTDQNVKKVESKQEEGRYSVVRNFAGEYIIGYRLEKKKNIIKIRVTAQDGTTSMEYTICVNKIDQTDNPGEGTPDIEPVPSEAKPELASIEIAEKRTSGDWYLIPYFSSSSFEYNVDDIPSAQKTLAVSVKPVGKPKKIEMRLNEAYKYTQIFEKNGYYTNEFNLKSGNNTVEIKVTANGGKYNVYTLNITRAYIPAPETSVYLTSIKVNNKSVPGFNKTKTTYNLGSVDYQQSSVRIRVLPESADISSIQLFEGAVSIYEGDIPGPVFNELHSGSGEYETEYKLNVGENRLKIRVTADTYKNFTYVLSISRKQNTLTPPPAPEPQKSTNANLSNIGVYTTSQNVYGYYNDLKDFNPNKTQYQLGEVNSDQSKFFIKVRPEDSSIQKVEMKAGNYGYRVVDAYYGSYKKEFSLDYGPNEISVRVTAQAGNTKEYTLTIDRKKEDPPSDNAYLKSIETAENRNSNDWRSVPHFSSSITSYTIPEIKHTQNTLAVSVVPQDKENDVKVKIEMKGPGMYSYVTVAKNNDNSYRTKEFSGLRDGENKFYIRVTAADGYAKKEYTVSVYRKPAPEPTPDPTPTPSPGTKSDYAILVYGCGGGNLDNMLDMNLAEAARAGSNANVQMAIQIKYSRRFQSNPKLAGTLRKVLKGNRWETKTTLSNQVDLGKADTLRDFLKWAEKEVPAKEYMLIIWNHGDVWDPISDSPTPRSIDMTENVIEPYAAIYDDVLGHRALSTASLAKGVRDSGINVSTVYFDVCLMLMMETVAEIHEHAKIVKYVMGAEHLTPGVGGNYKLLMQIFGEGGTSKSSYEDKLKRYVLGTATTQWWNRVRTPHDLSVVKMGNDFRNVMDAMKSVADSIHRLNEKQKSHVLNYAYTARYKELGGQGGDREKSTDLLYFINLIAGNAKNSQITNSYQRLSSAIDNGFLIRARNNKCRLRPPSIGILVMKSKNFVSVNYENYDRQYKQTVFDKKVGWSRILQEIYKY